MATLQITITSVNTTDWDNNPITIKQATSTIGGVDTTIITTNPDSDTDQQVTDNHESVLTSQGFTWDN